MFFPVFEWFIRILHGFHEHVVTEALEGSGRARIVIETDRSGLIQILPDLEEMFFPLPSVNVEVVPETIVAISRAEFLVLYTLLPDPL